MKKKDWPYPRIFAHRGGGTLAPENTLAAIRVGQSLGYRGHEFDVKLTRDGVAMLLHDPDLERTTNGQGRPADLDWASVRRLDAGGWHSEAYRGEPIPSFEDVARLLRAQDTMANIEIKPTPGFDRATGAAIARETQRLWKGAAVAPLFSSFSFEALMAAKEVAPEIPRGWLISRFTDADWERLTALDALSLHTNYRKLDAKRIPELHERGYNLFVYTINEADEAQRWLDAGADALVTDNLRDFAQRFRALI